MKEMGDGCNVNRTERTGQAQGFKPSGFYR
ncbi:hypothetical protein LINPERHAP1_LOCUS9484 [Linum perenne]